MSLLNFSLFFAFNFLILTTECSEWNYEEHGPDLWAHEYEACSGRLQSPINIETSKAIYNKSLGPFNFFGYENILFWNISNNGHTIMSNQIRYSNASDTPYITGSDLSEKYYLQQFHFHWGFNIFQGSEHHMDEKKFPGELHLVHKSDSGTLAVLGFLFQISEENNTNLNSLLDIVEDDITTKDFFVTPLILNSIIYDIESINSNGYYRYKGSLTTPPCTEGVIWTIFNYKINISEKQMQSFYKNEIAFNYRDVQSLNNRTLYTSLEPNVITPAILDPMNPILLLIINLFNLTIQLLTNIIGNQQN